MYLQARTLISEGVGELTGLHMPEQREASLDLASGGKALRKGGLKGSAGRRARPPYRPKDLQGPLGLLALPESADEGIVGYYIRHHALPLH